MTAFMCGVCRHRSQCVQSALLSDLAEQTAAEPAHAAEHGQVGSAPWCLGTKLCEGPVTCLLRHTIAPSAYGSSSMLLL